MASFLKVPRKKSKSGFAWKAVITQRGLSQITKTFTSKALAKAWAERTEADQDRMKALGDPMQRTRNVETMIKAFRKDYPNREKNKDQIILTRLDWWKAKIGHMKLIDVDSSVVREYRQQLLTEVCTEGRLKGKTRSRPTCNRYLAALSTVYSDAVEWGWVTSNPCKGIKRGGENNGFGRSVTDKEETALLEACRASGWDRLYLFVLMALMTGARRGELLRLTWGDVNLKAGTAMLTDTKNGDSRELVLLAPVVAELQKFRNPDPKITELRDSKTDELIFRSKGDAFRPRPIAKPWYTALKTAEIENLRFHDLRHSCASYLTNENVSDVLVAEILGHKTLAMVKRYSHAKDAAKRDAMKQAFSHMSASS